MTESHSAFIEAIPATYDKYLGPLIFDTYAEDLAKRIQCPDNGRLLETGAGTGLATRKIRDSVDPSVRIIATDLNADMLKLAALKFEDNDNIEFLTANAQELKFEDSVFDAIACQFSLMFFPDKLAALKEAARVLKPGGKLYFNIWDSFEHNAFVQVTHQAIASFFDHEQLDFFETPYGYYQIDVIKELLGSAGFGDIEISVLPRLSSAPDPRHVALGYILGTPVRVQIEKVAAGSLSEVVTRVEQALTEEFGSGPVSAKMQAIVFSAQLAG